MADYQFSNNWFQNYWHCWLTLTEGLEVRRILEVGSYEGQSACTMIDHFGAANDLTLTCVDTWGGGREHAYVDMADIEARFDANIELAVAQSPHAIEVRKLKGYSYVELARLLAQGRSDAYDIVFIDGSHEAADVLSDCVLGYHLCRPGGLIICDDYLWSLETSGQEVLTNMPKLGIDAFSLAFARKVRQIPTHLYQVYFNKIA